MNTRGGKEKIYQAIPVSPGIAIGRVFPFRRKFERNAAPEDRSIAPAAAEAEIGRFKQALSDTCRELKALQEQVRTNLKSAEANIFDAHLLIVDDQTLINEVSKFIREKHKTADFAFHQVIEKYVAVLSGMSDEYLRERAVDIRDVAARIASHLTHEEVESLEQLHDRRIIVAADLNPSETVQLDRSKVLGFAIESGSATSHTAILARSMKLPALTGIPHELIEALASGDKAIIDGFSGKFIVNPERRTEETYRLKAEETGKLISDLQRGSLLTSETMDGFMVQLAANLETAEGLEELAQVGACGIGLFRTEYLFLNRHDLPTEEEQFEVYKKILVANDGRPVIIRTLDVGGDKFIAHIYRSPEENPFLGLRGIRLCLHECRDVFRTQLRALLRAGVFGNLKVMLPMISCVEEITETRTLVRELQAELAAKQLDFVPRLSLGAMIETPAAALQTDLLAPLVDFFSIGTNDLVQYTMAIDRGNERVAYLYQPAHPVILKLIRLCVESAKKNNIWVSVCGQMAADPRYTPLLVGLGVHELSMEPSSIGAVRRVIRGLSMHEAENLASKALSCDTSEEVIKLSLKLLRKAAPTVVELIDLS
jgi:phosphotransferase system enzyme I (PtsI)